MVRGTGTLLNVATVLLGSGIGVLLGNRLPERTRDVVTDGLGLVTLLVAATSAAAVLDPSCSDAVGSSAPVLIVLGVGARRRHRRVAAAASRTGWRASAPRSGARLPVGRAGPSEDARTGSSRGSSPRRWSSASGR